MEFLVDHAGDLQEVVRHLRAHQPPVPLLELQVDPLPEPRAVVVTLRLRVPERLHDRVGVHNFGRHVLLAGGAGHLRDVGQHQLGRLRLPGPRLAGDQHRLLLARLTHAGLECYGE